ncbi:unnamed protein product [marine sediment metagenome]|uniref:Uncharacterized protein n=1 Tax=marine sediment metagenome TaxID=412755 RepID=X0TWG2_9ZZZZ
MEEKAFQLAVLGSGIVFGSAICIGLGINLVKQIKKQRKEYNELIARRQEIERERGDIVNQTNNWFDQQLSEEEIVKTNWKKEGF